MKRKLNVSRGKVRGTYHIIKFGENLDVDGSMETIWDGGGLYTYLTNAATVTVTSTDNDDAASGTGARTVTVEGLDANYNQVSETLTVGGSAGSVEFSDKTMHLLQHLDLVELMRELLVLLKMQQH